MIVVGRAGPEYAKRIHWYIEMGVHDRQASERGCGHGDPMIRALQRDNLLFLWLASHIEIVMQHLDVRVIGFTTGICKENLCVRYGHHLAERISQLHG